MSSAEALKAGLRGKALRITHHYRDLLWYSLADNLLKVDFLISSAFIFMTCLWNLLQGVS